MIHKAGKPKPYSESKLLSWAKPLFGAQGTLKWVIFILCVGSLGLTMYSVVSHASREPELSFSQAGWTGFFYIGGLWLAMNVSLSGVLGLLEGPRWGVPYPSPKRFEAFPLFAWQCPAIQQALFFWTVPLYIVYLWCCEQHLARWPLHCVASLFGQQARELVLFDSDRMMVLHHVVTMGMSVMIWFTAMDERVDRITAAMMAASCASMEAGSLGVCIWTIWQNGPAYAALMTGSHIICLFTGLYAMWRARDHYMVYVMCLPSLGLMYQRQMYMIKEIVHGAPTGGFANHREKAASDSSPRRKTAKKNKVN